MFRKSSVTAIVFLAFLVGWSALALGQTQTPPVPKPFPQPAQAGQGAPPVVKPVREQAKPASPATQGAPTDAMLGGFPVYDGATFLASYDAGQGQRYYLFGTNTSFGEVVAWYKGALTDKGELVFEEPPVHEFDIGKYREETMAFPPSVTVKDYTWGGMKGYLNPKPGANPQRYKTIIQIVPPPAGRDASPAGIEN